MQTKIIYLNDLKDFLNMANIEEHYVQTNCSNQLELRENSGICVAVLTCKSKNQLKKFATTLYKQGFIIV